MEIMEVLKITEPTLQKRKFFLFISLIMYDSLRVQLFKLGTLYVKRMNDQN